MSTFFIHKYNQMSNQALAIPIVAVPKVSEFIHEIVSGKKVIFEVGDKVICIGNVSFVSGEKGTVKAVYDQKKEVHVKFENGAAKKVSFLDVKKI